MLVWNQSEREAASPVGLRASPLLRAASPSSTGQYLATNTHTQQHGMHMHPIIVIKIPSVDRLAFYQPMGWLAAGWRSDRGDAISAAAAAAASRRSGDFLLTRRDRQHFRTEAQFSGCKKLSNEGCDI